MSAPNESVPSAAGPAEPLPGMLPAKSRLELLETSKMDVGATEPQRSLAGVLPPVAEAIFLFALIGVSVGLAITLLQLPDETFTAYMIKNTLPRPSRQAVLLSMAASAGVACAVPFGWLLFKKSWSVDKLVDIAWRLSPLIIAGFLPCLFYWKLWERREVEFLTLAAALTWGLRRLVLVAASRPPLGIGAAMKRTLGRFGVVARTGPLRERIANAMPTLLAWTAAAAYAA